RRVPGAVVRGAAADAPGPGGGHDLHLRDDVGELLRALHAAAEPREPARRGDAVHLLLPVRPGRLRPARRVLDLLLAAGGGAVPVPGPEPGPGLRRRGRCQGMNPGPTTEGA